MSQNAHDHPVPAGLGGIHLPYSRDDNAIVRALRKSNVNKELNTGGLVALLGHADGSTIVDACCDCYDEPIFAKRRADTFPLTSHDSKLLRRNFSRPTVSPVSSSAFASYWSFGSERADAAIHETIHLQGLGAQFEEFSFEARGLRGSVTEQSRPHGQSREEVQQKLRASSKVSQGPNFHECMVCRWWKRTTAVDRPDISVAETGQERVASHGWSPIRLRCKLMVLLCSAVILCSATLLLAQSHTVWSDSRCTQVALGLVSVLVAAVLAMLPDAARRTFVEVATGTALSVGMSLMLLQNGNQSW